MANDSGVAAKVRVAAWLLNEFDLEILSFGRAGLARKGSCKLEICGRYLLFDLTLDCAFIFVSATPLY